MKRLKALHLKEAAELTRDEMQQLFGGYECSVRNFHM